MNGINWRAKWSFYKIGMSKLVAKKCAYNKKKENSVSSNQFTFTCGLQIPKLWDKTVSVEVYLQNKCSDKNNVYFK